MHSSFARELKLAPVKASSSSSSSSHCACWRNVLKRLRICEKVCGSYFVVAVVVVVVTTVECFDNFESIVVVVLLCSTASKEWFNN